MPGLHLFLEGDNCWPDMKDKVIRQGVDLSLAALRAGMESGKPSISVRVDLADGSVAFVETSLILLLSAADAFKAKYGDPR
jgi:hypothetical protein